MRGEWQRGGTSHEPHLEPAASCSVPDPSGMWPSSPPTAPIDLQGIASRLTITPSHPHPHTLTPSYPHTIIPSHPHPHTLTPSYPHTIIPSHPHHHTLTPSHHHHTLELILDTTAPATMATPRPPSHLCSPVPTPAGCERHCFGVG